MKRLKHIIHYDRLNEENGPDEVEDLDFLKDIGLINQAEYSIATKKLGINQRIIEAVLDSPEWSQLQALGFTLVSTLQQLKNGTFVIYKPGARRKLGIFINGYLRRMYLAPQERTVEEAWGQDAVVRKFESNGQELYFEAMRWIGLNIDPESSEMLTKRASNTLLTSADKIAGVVEKIYNEFERYGFPREAADLLYGGQLIPRTASDANEYLKIVKQYLKMGVLPYYPMNTNIREDRRGRLYELLASNRWINILGSHLIKVPLDSSIIWPSFDYALQVSIMHQVLICFQDGSQVEEYRGIFNDYNPIDDKPVKFRVESWARNI
jgi:hypothetical protein